MKNDRIGDWLWEEWDGEEFDSDGTVYCTYDWVDLENDIVKRALASCLQRDGVVDSLSDGFRVAENSLVHKTYAGFVDESKVLTICNEYGETELGDNASSISMVTLVEF